MGLVGRKKMRLVHREKNPHSKVVLNMVKKCGRGCEKKVK